MYELERKSIQNSEGGPCQVLAVRGNLGIAVVRKLKDDLLALLKNNDSVVIDLTEVSDIYYSILQLMCSANKYAQKHGKTFKLTGQNAHVVMVEAQSVGYFRAEGCKDAKDPTRCLWLAETSA